MKCTVLNIGGNYEVTGLRELSNGKYEMVYSSLFGNKQYKTEKNAIRAILRVGYEYIKTDRKDLVVAFD